MRLKVSENMVLYWKDGQLICDNFVTHDQRALSPSVEPLLEWFSNWKDIESLVDFEETEGARAISQALIRQLVDASILIVEGSDEHQREDQLRGWDTWRRSTKFFHFSARTPETTQFLAREDDGLRLIEKAKHCPAPPLYKEYPSAVRVPLAVPNHACNDGPAHDGFADVLLRRRTSRILDQDKPVTFDQLSTLLYYVCGSTHIAHSIGTGNVLLKTSPSGGARHPIEVYPCILNVTGVAPGFYHYSVKTHELELIDQRDVRDQVAAMCGDQAGTSTSSVILFYTAVIERSMWKYSSPRAYRFMMMDLGHLSQTFFLVAAWLGLGAFFVGALREGLIERELGLGLSEEIVLGASGTGIPTSDERAEGPTPAAVEYHHG